MSTVAPDDNLLPGQTYTFSFSLGNWFSLPSTSAVQAELAANAPNFISNVQVQQKSGIGLLTNYYDVTFTYTGDGSDVASDVASEMIAAFAAGGDSFSLTSMDAGSVGSSAQQDLTAGAGIVGNTVGTAVGNALNQAGVGLGTGWTIVIVLGLAAVILFEIGGVSGIRRSFA